MAYFRPSDPGFPAIPVDGHDAVGVYRVASEAMAHARRGSGPTLIQCLPSPFGQMDGRRGCPLANMERYLAGRKLISDGWAARLARRFTRELEAALPKTARRPSNR
jgi:TPP-dependent pyruvate/acetoin dehydrogenase alpha subunit